MKKLSFLCLVLLTGSLMCANPLPDPQWMWTILQSGMGDDSIEDIIYSDNVISVTGYISEGFYGDPGIISAGGSDIFVCDVLDGYWDGYFVNCQRFGGSGDDHAYSIDIDSNGNKYITGFFENSVVLGSTTLTSRGDKDVFIAKLDTENNIMWAKSAGGTGFDSGMGLDIDSSDSLFITGHFSSSANFGNEVIESNGNQDVFIAKLDSDGNWIWVKHTGGIGVDGICNIVTDLIGNCYIAGWFSNSAEFGTTELNSTGGSDSFIAKLDADGNFLWAKRSGGMLDDFSDDLCIEGNSTVIVTGIFNDIADIGPYSVSHYSHGAGVYVVRLDMEGNWLVAEGGFEWFLNAYGCAVCYNPSYQRTYLAWHSYGQYYGLHSIINIYELNNDLGGWGLPKVFNNEQARGLVSALCSDSVGDIYLSGGTTIQLDDENPNNALRDLFVAKANFPHGPFSPVELSSFSAVVTAQNNIQVIWVSQSETDMLGYRLYRNTNEDQSTSTLITPVLIQATNTSTTQTYSYTDAEVTAGQTYYYWLEGADVNSTDYYGPVSVMVQDYNPPLLPDVTTLINTYPNPLIAGVIANIDVTVKAGENGSLGIYNLRGQLVRNFSISEGPHTITWDGKDSSGNPCGMGVYYIKLATPSMTQKHKMIILK